ncbi:MAG TPA: hypothetical protein VGR54_09340 [Nitrosopumilaceae archaeon]|nr:hypothetical protein [Nitrosopumilaceae archaeon]
MKSKTFVVTLVAAFVASALLFPLAGAVGDFLAIKIATTQSDTKQLEAKLITHGLIPKDGSGGAFGYGILTSAGLDGIIVATTHAGVLDSAVQTNANDPAWHNHFVKLASQTACGGGPGVVDITFESPGKVKVQGDKIKLEDIPSTFTGTNPLTGSPTTITPGTNVQNVVSFKLNPVFDSSNNLEAVCVTDITPAEKLKINPEGNNENNDNKH